MILTSFDISHPFGYGGSYHFRFTTDGKLNLKKVNNSSCKLQVPSYKLLDINAL